MAVNVVLAGLAVGVCAIFAPRLIEVRRQRLHSLCQQSPTVNGLLNFSQAVQGAGRSEQIYQALAHHLRAELCLTGVAVLTHDPEAVPPNALAATWPEMPAADCAAVCELETSMCPCLRQGLPWQFEPSGGPIRCGLDKVLKLPADQPAYCIPFSFGCRVRVVVPMLLAPGEKWTDHRRQVAQAYVNAAQAALGSLHLLAEAERQCMNDPLTGLYNRRSLDQLLLREVALAERHGHPLAVVMVDLDGFKQINDAHGHAAGDHVLRAFADCVRITLHRTDMAFR